MTRYRHSYWLGEVFRRLAKRRVSTDWFRWSQLDSVRILFDYHHDGDVIVDAMASQITSRTIVYSTVYPSAAQRKHQSSASLAFVRGIHRRFHEVLFIIHQLNDLAPLSDKILPNQKYGPFCPQCPWAMGSCFNIKAQFENWLQVGWRHGVLVLWKEFPGDFNVMPPWDKDPHGYTATNVYLVGFPKPYRQVRPSHLCRLDINLTRWCWIPW